MFSVNYCYVNPGGGITTYILLSILKKYKEDKRKQNNNKKSLYKTLARLFAGEFLAASSSKQP